ncbi:MAG: NfeD family protein [Acidobacteriota bacterium]
MMGVPWLDLYTACLLLGVAYALVATVLGWLLGHGDGDVHVDATGHLDLGHPSPVSGTTLATFVTGFGGGGVFSKHLLGLSPVATMLAATATGLLLAGAAFAVLDFLFARTQGGSEYRADDVAGKTAEVITSLPAGGTGEVAYVIKGQRERASAKAIDGSAIPKGSRVTVVQMVGSTAHVRPTNLSDDDT